LMNFQQRDPVGFLLPLLMLQTRDHIVVGRETDHALWTIGRRPSPVVQLRNSVDDGPYRRAVFRLHDHALASTRDAAQFSREKRLRPRNGHQLHGDEWRRMRSAHNCSTSQSATTFTPAFRSSANSASLIAEKTRTPRSPRKAGTNRSTAGLTSA